MTKQSLEQKLRSARETLELRVEAGEREVAESVLMANPDLASDVESALELIYAEYVALEALGERPPLENWLTRFPKYRERLEKLARLHDLMATETSDLPDETIGGTGTTKLPIGLGRFGEYDVLEELARGGMGVVYRARDLKLNREVALKVVLAGIGSSPNDLARFRSEAETVANLRHANIVQIFEIGEAEGRPYLTLEYAPNGTLTDWAGGNPVAAWRAAEMVRTLAGAVHYAHQQQVIHRDLKPANVLLSADGQPKLTDFGLAKRLDLDDGQTRIGDILGTPAYMSPEQASGVRDVGPSTDIFALGVILYELITGRVPFSGVTTAETLEQIKTLQPISPRSLLTNIPRDLETICLKCMEKSPRDRYESAEHLVDDLQRFIGGEPILACPDSMLRQIAKTVLRGKRDFPKYRQWSRICFCLAPLPPLVHLLVTLLCRTLPAYPYIALATTVTTFGVAEAAIANLTREGRQFLPKPVLRNARNLVAGYWLAQVFTVFVLWWRTPAGQPDGLLTIYPVSCLLISVLFWGLAGDLGVLYISGLGALILSVPCVLFPEWSPFAGVTRIPSQLWKSGPRLSLVGRPIRLRRRGLVRFMIEMTESFALKVIHVACASVWFGSSWLAATDIRRTVDLGRPHTDILPERIGRLERVAITSGVTTFLTGLAVAAWTYGLMRLPTRLYWVIGLTVATMMVGGFFASPAWGRVRTVIEQGGDLDAARVDARRFERFMWVEHALRLATLAFVVGRDALGH